MIEKIKKHAQEIIHDIIIGNELFTKHHDHAYFNAFHDSQTPEVTLLTCSDSRVQVNVLGLDAMNEIFVVRNIGNQIMPVFGSIDYGVMHLKTPLLIIMGHTHCGAVKAVFSNYDNEPFDIIRELDHLSIPMRHLKHNAHDVEKEWMNIIEHNVDYQVKLAVKKYKDLVETGELHIIGLVDDFIDIYKSGEGRLIIMNINGETDLHKLREHPLLSMLKGEQKKIVVKRKIHAIV